MYIYVYKCIYMYINVYKCIYIYIYTYTFYLCISYRNHLEYANLIELKTQEGFSIFSKL